MTMRQIISALFDFQLSVLLDIPPTELLAFLVIVIGGACFTLWVALLFFD